MFTPESILEYGKYSAIATIAMALLMIIGLVAKWGFRFRLVGVTGFLMVLTVGLFGLGLGFAPRSALPGASRYSLIYDNGNSQVVIAVPDAHLTYEQTEATLRQAANDLYSYGRGGGTDGKMHVRLRTIAHPQPGLSEPLYLGEIARTLTNRSQPKFDIKIDRQQLAKL
jgi:Protein of function (DUF2518)